MRPTVNNGVCVCGILSVQRCLLGRNIEQDTFVMLAMRGGARGNGVRLIRYAQVKRRNCIEMTAFALR